MGERISIADARAARARTSERERERERVLVTKTARHLRASPYSVVSESRFGPRSVFSEEQRTM